MTFELGYRLQRKWKNAKFEMNHERFVNMKVMLEEDLELGDIYK
jgi:hypothetical protein